MRMFGAMALGFLLALGAAGSLAEQGSHEDHEPQSGAHQGIGASSAGTGHEMNHQGAEMCGPAMPGGMGMHAMHERMQTLRDHSKRMEEITDQKQLAEEMKKHMRMTDEMMEQILPLAGLPPTPARPGAR